MKSKNTKKIDTGEIPEITPEQFAKAIVRYNLKPVEKKSLFTLRVEPDVLRWYRNFGQGYQTKMSQILKAYMVESKKHSSLLAR
jgi:uncharacterized protein (DUF4415 family)